MPYFLNPNESKNKIMYDYLLELIVKNKIGNRPGRMEPRAIKRRPKAFPLLQKPRQVEKTKLMKKVEKIKLKDTLA
jgi:hypothetical protein